MRVRGRVLLVVGANGQRLSCVSSEEADIALICAGLSVILIVIKCK